MDSFSSIFLCFFRKLPAKSYTEIAVSEKEVKTNMMNQEDRSWIPYDAFGDYSCFVQNQLEHEENEIMSCEGKDRSEESEVF